MLCFKCFSVPLTLLLQKSASLGIRVTCEAVAEISSEDLTGSVFGIIEVAGFADVIHSAPGHKTAEEHLSRHETEETEGHTKPA